MNPSFCQKIRSMGAVALVTGGALLGTSPALAAAPVQNTPGLITEAFVALQSPGEEKLLAFLQTRDVNAPIHRGWTLLHLAASRGDAAKTRLLLERGADPVLLNQDRQTARDLAAAMGYTELLSILPAPPEPPAEPAREEQEPELLRAAREDRVDRLRELIMSGCPVDTTMPDGMYRGMTALMVAARVNNSRAIEFLLTAGARIQACDTDGWQAIHYAALHGSTEALRLLLLHGADINAAKKDGFTPLMLAARAGHLPSVEFLLSRGANPVLANEANLTARDLAASMEHTDIVHIIPPSPTDILSAAIPAPQTVAPAAPAQAQPEEEVIQMPELIREAELGHTGRVRRLIEQGAEPDVCLTAGPRQGLTPLLAAACSGYGRTVRYLIDAGADVNAARADGYTALMYSAQKGQTDILAELIAAGADVNATRGDGFTPLMLAAINGQTDCVRLLLDKGADPALTSHAGMTARDIAAAEGYYIIVGIIPASPTDSNPEGIIELQTDEAEEAELPDIIRAARDGQMDQLRDLIRNGAGLDTVVPAGMYAGMTPLMAATDAGQMAAMDYLLSCGADLYARDCDGWQAIHYAARAGRTEPVRLLLDRGADPDSTKDDGYTPLMLAACNGHPELVRYLLDEGSDPTLRNKAGQTAADLARGAGHSVCELILTATAE